MASLRVRVEQVVAGDDLALVDVGRDVLVALDDVCSLALVGLASGTCTRLAG